MTDNFDQILDECLTRLIRGGTVEDCLARYPERREELEPHLRLAARLARSYGFTPSPAAKARGRQRVLAELTALESSRTAPRVRLRLPVINLVPRWATAAVALVLALVTLGGGAATVAASGGTLPGDALYPVKRATEQARLAVAFSQPAKADLHLQYAERRAEETGRLTLMERVSQLEATQTSLKKNLEQATAIAEGLDEPQKLGSLQARLEASASLVLGRLQLVLESAPESSKEAARENLKASGEGYGEAVEAVAARGPARQAAAKPGLLRLVVSDSAPLGVDEMILEVSDVRALLTGREGRWIIISQEPQSLDLVRLGQADKLLGESAVEAGTYTKLRLRVTQAWVRASGVQYKVKVPSASLNLVRPFKVEEGKTTVVTIEIDGPHSLRRTGQGDYILAPVIQLLTNEPGGDGAKLAQHDDDARPDKKQTPTMDKAPASATSALPPVREELEGTIERITEDALIVSGRRVLIPPDTKVDGTLAVGARVRVDAVITSGGTLAVSVKVVDDKAPAATPEERPADTEEEGPSPSRATPTIPGDSERRIEIKGTIDEINSLRWSVKGQVVVVSSNTVIEGAPSAGLTAEVEGVRQADGSIIALEIRVKEERRAPTQEKRPTPSPSPKPTPTSTLQPTSTPQRTSTPTPTPTWTPMPSPTPTLTPMPSITTFEGIVEGIKGAEWTVGGRRVVVDLQTKIEGLPLIGSRVGIVGVLRPDGTVLATKITLLQRPGLPGVTIGD